MRATIVQSMGALVAMVGLSFATAPATTAETVSANEHCAVRVDAVAEAQAMPEPTCFESTDELDDYLTEIGVGVAGRGTTASIIIGTVYKNSGGTGDSLTFWGSSGCAGTTFGFASLAAGWDNSISSARGQNGCWVTLYTATSYGGQNLNCTPYCASIGGWNDNVKSLVFRPTGTFG